MKKRKTARQLANEAWRMLPDECKEIMKDVKKSYINSLQADIAHALNIAWENGLHNGIC